MVKRHIKIKRWTYIFYELLGNQTWITYLKFNTETNKAKQMCKAAMWMNAKFSQVLQWFFKKRL